MTLFLSKPVPGELFTFEVDRRHSADPVERRGYFASERKGYAFASPINDVKVVTYGGVNLVVACSVPEGGVRVWDLEADDGSKPLHIFKGHTDDIRCLAWYGVGVNVTDAAGTSPLMTAAELGLEDIVKMLLDCVGIDPWIGDRQSCETALHRCVKSVLLRGLLGAKGPARPLSPPTNLDNMPNTRVRHERPCTDSYTTKGLV